MPRIPGPPKYRHHKARNLAVVTIHGKDKYLGPYQSPESWERYAREIAKWDPTRPSPLETKATALTINELILAFLQHSETYYAKNGRKTGEFDNIRLALRHLKNLYGRTQAASFRPSDLEAVRESMIAANLSRGVINGRVSRIKRAFKWGVRKELVSAPIYHGLLSVDGLKWGRSKARETEPVPPAPAWDTFAAAQYMNRHIRSMASLQELSGMRSQDLCNMRLCDIDMSRDVWVYQPCTHKTEHHGHVRRIALGPSAQAILRAFIKFDEPDAYVFRPCHAVEEQRVARRQNRKTPMTPSQARRQPKSAPKRSPKCYYTPKSYQKAILRSCERANVPIWHAHQLRHNCGTKVRRLYGLDAASIVLGHRHGVVTEVYAEADFERAIDVMRTIG